MSSAVNSVGSTVADSVAPNGQFQPLALFVPQLRERFRLEREREVRQAETDAAMQKIQANHMLSSQAVVDRTFAQQAIDTGDPTQQQAVGQQVEENARQRAAAFGAREAPRPKGSTLRVGGVVQAGQGVRTALGVDEKQIADRQAKGAAADATLPVPFALLQGMTPEQRTIVRQAYAQALGQTKQQNAAQSHINSLAIARENRNHSAAHDALKLMHGKGVLPPNVEQAVGSMLNGGLGKNSPAFSGMFDIVQRTAFPTTQIQLTGSLDQKSTVGALEQDLAETQNNLRVLNSVAQNFDPGALTFIGQGRSAAGTLAE
jgi:hypothetical protein